MSNAPASIDQALDDFLATIDFPTSRIAFPNVTYRPKAGTPYLRASMASRTSKPVTLGRDIAFGGGGYVNLWRGVYQVDAVWPEDAGSKGCSEMQGKVLRLFKLGTTLSCSDGLIVIIDNASALPIRPDAAWVRGPVQCSWYCHEAS